MLRSKNNVHFSNFVIWFNLFSYSISVLVSPNYIYFLLFSCFDFWSQIFVSLQRAKFRRTPAATVVRMLLSVSWNWNANRDSLKLFADRFGLRTGPGATTGSSVISWPWQQLSTRPVYSSKSSIWLTPLCLASYGSSSRQDLHTQVLVGHLSNWILCDQLAMAAALEKTCILK